MNARFVDMAGSRFGRLVVVARAENVGTRAAWQCQCDCGRLTAVVGKELRSGNTRSCGCLMNEARLVAGRKNKTHGMTKSREWETWSSMRRRCEDPAHKSFAD